ncbi:MAG: DUF3592 domain-containing protein [Gemmataceae bacterium]
MAADRPFLAFLENAAFLEGKSRYITTTAGSLFMISIFTWCLLAGTALLTPIMILEYLKAARLQSSGVATQCVVTNKHTQWSRRGGTAHYLDYSFRDADGMTITGSTGLPKDVWDRLQPGMAVSVLYDREDPSRSVLTGDAGRQKLNFAVFAGVILVSGLGLAAILGGLAYQMRQLIKHGTRLPGRILSFEGGLIQYEFVTPEGQTIQHKVQVSLLVMNEQPFLAENVPVAILYRNDKHHVML